MQTFRQWTVILPEDHRLSVKTLFLS